MAVQVGWSEYDAAVPGAVAEAGVLDRVADLRAARLPAAGSLADVREVVVVASSSRGGSTALGELLRAVPGTVHLSAESNPLVVVASQVGDRRRAFEDELRADLGTPTADVDLDAFAVDVTWRLTLQWPDERFDVDRVRGWVAEALGGGPFDRVAFGVRLLRHVRAAHAGVDPWYYDLPGDAVRSAFPGLREPAGPPGPVVLEMPPFVVPAPWRHVAAGAGPVVLTTPRNSYRLPFLRDLFPSARFRVLHLVRNPAAAVNGLVDGWRHRGFFTCDVGRPLAISGYSGAPVWSRRWWNFDLPPDWEELTASSLPAVCARQWCSAHEATLDFAGGEPGVDLLRVRHEDLVGPDPGRREALRSVAAWLGVDDTATQALLDDRPRAVMATAPPRPRRWTARARAMAPVLRDERVLGLAERLGYRPDPRTWT